MPKVELIRIKHYLILYLKRYRVIRKVYTIAKKYILYCTELVSIRAQTSSRLFVMSNEAFVKAINKSSFLFFISPVSRSLINKTARQNKREELTSKWLDIENTISDRRRLLFSSMLYLEPHDLPELLLFEILDQLDEEHLLPAYRFLFNAYFPYNNPNERNRYILFLRSALTWFNKNLERGPKQLSEQKINIFSRTYSGSVPLANTINMKDIFVVERSILKRHIKILYPNLYDRKLVCNDIVKKRKIGLIRNNYRGEIDFFTPLLGYLSSDAYEVHMIVFDEDGINKVRESYPNLKHHLLNEENPRLFVEYIRNLGLDIVLNTTSISGRFNAPVAIALSYRVAPIQLTACADVTTSGIEAIDYFIMGERYSDPALSEEMIENILPCPGIGFYMPVPPKVDGSYMEKRKEIGVKDDEILFVSNSNLFKLGPELLTNWLKILNKISQAKLLLMPFNSRAMQTQFGPEFFIMLNRICEEYQIPISQIIVAKAQGREETMSQILAGDIYLDSFPYCGATSTTEALSVGLPVVTLKGQFYRGQLTAGLLEELGMSELVADSIEEYIDLAVSLAASKELREKIVGEIGVRLKTASFFDAQTIANQFDTLFTSLCSRSISLVDKGASAPH